MLWCRYVRWPGRPRFGWPFLFADGCEVGETRQRPASREERNERSKQVAALLCCVASIIIATLYLTVTRVVAVLVSSFPFAVLPSEFDSHFSNFGASESFASPLFSAVQSTLRPSAPVFKTSLICPLSPTFIGPRNALNLVALDGRGSQRQRRAGRSCKECLPVRSVQPRQMVLLRLLDSWKSNS